MAVENGVGQDRRMFERVLLRCPVRFKTEEEDEEVLEASAKDFSDGGLGFFTDAKIEPEMHLEMWIKLSPQIKPLHIGGKVVWAEKRRPDLWRAGICFDELAFLKVVKLLLSKNLN